MLRKCEKHDKNRFSRAFSATQPNTRKYFPKHFLECSQTLENIFLSQKYFTPKNILYSENILHLTKRSLSLLSLLLVVPITLFGDPTFLFSTNFRLFAFSRLSSTKKKKKTSFQFTVGNLCVWLFSTKTIFD